MRPALILIATTALAACTPMDGMAGIDPDNIDPNYCAQTRGWTAFVNAMPGPGAQPTLIVTGEAYVPEGWQATLIPGPTDRMQPPGQRFSVTLEPAADQPLGWQQVRYELKPALMAYREVTIGCGGQIEATITEVEVAQ